MRMEYSASNFLPDLVAGFINAIISIAFALALATIVFTGPLSEYLSQGIGTLLISTIILSLLSAIWGSHPLIVSGPQEIPVIVLALIVATVASHPDANMSPTHLFQFLLVAIGLTSVLIGFSFLILGWLKLGKLVRIIPVPVIGGFLAGIGWLIIEFAFNMMTSLEFNFSNIFDFFDEEIFKKWFPGFVFAVILLIVKRHYKHFLITPTILLTGITLFYAIMFSQGVSYSSMEECGYLLGPFPTGGLFPGFAVEYTDNFRWDLYLLFMPMIAVTVVLSATEALLYYTALETLVEEDVDLDKELRLTGFSNIISGMAGAPAGFIRLSQVAVSKNIGAKSRIPGLMVALICTLTLVFGDSVLSAFPKVILGGLLLNLGLTFLVDWLFDTWKKFPRSDYFIIVLIFIITVSIGSLEGVLAGLILSVIFFVIDCSKINIVKNEKNGKIAKSNVERSEWLEKATEQQGEQILIISLQGFLFFGSTSQLLKPVINRLNNDECVPLRFVVFDFRQITGLDCSVINIFRKLNVKAKNENFSVVFCSLSEYLSKRLLDGGLISDESKIIQNFDDLDHGLEWCEEELIKNTLRPAAVYNDTVKPESSDFHAIISGFAGFLESRFVSSGTTFIRQGLNPGGIYFIESGEIIVVLDTGQGNQVRLKAMGAGTIVGEMSLYSGGNATASVIAKEDCRVKFLSRDNFEKMNLHDPKQVSQLHIFIVKLLSNRLAKSNQTTQALLS